jgi:hypothetical protein
LWWTCTMFTARWKVHTFFGYQLIKIKVNDCWHLDIRDYNPTRCFQ